MRLLLAVLLAMTFGGSRAQKALNDIKADRYLSAANYLAYPGAGQSRLTPAPKGYAPFYISTYMRHGSRFHINPSDYAKALAPLQKADSAGALSATGRQVLRKVERISRMSDGRLGELTSLGARQHREIAARMFANYPEIFGGDITVDARSTVVIRCILSMTAECLQLQKLNPKLKFFNDASAHDMYYMNHHDKSISRYRRKERQAIVDSLRRERIHPERLTKLLFADTKYAEDNLKPAELMENLFVVAMNMQSHDDKTLDFYDIFTPEECYNLWTLFNAYWYLSSGNSPITDGRMPYREANLLRNIISTADSCMALKRPAATLRFGHESCLLPLAVLMELGDCGYSTADIATLDEHWQCYRYFPMACNIQLVFYRNPRSSDILVKALLNEREVTMPVSTDCAPYYHWADLEKYYNKKLERHDW